VLSSATAGGGDALSRVSDPTRKSEPERRAKTRLEPGDPNEDPRRRGKCPASTLTSARVHKHHQRSCSGCSRMGRPGLSGLRSSRSSSNGRVTRRRKALVPFASSVGGEPRDATRSSRSSLADASATCRCQESRFATTRQRSISSLWAREQRSDGRRRSHPRLLALAGSWSGACGGSSSVAHSGWPSTPVVPPPQSETPGKPLSRASMFGWFFAAWEWVSPHPDDRAR
jgi:hypothetical protein